ncbi:piggyBac transposable element-derived protein 2-like [Nematostella vectensis]|uniref:piggyBac transposable element-derived protein 2-like n=1 Tax=Nematostella vectensis TaxID=45351 RepID=UPI0020778F29|nr:piggyBac transposable element-derived protein 2-like [Nematostella vectensis]
MDSWFEDILGESDDEEFEGFESQEIGGSSSDSSSEDEGHESEDIEDEIWSRNSSLISIPDFTPRCGPKNLHGNLSPLSFFELFFKSEVIELIVTETSKYAVQCNPDDFDNEGRKKTKDANWFDKEGNIKPLTVEELKAFLGITIMMGIVKLPSMKDYWSESEPFLYQPNIARPIVRDRFFAILRYLHLCDNTTAPARGSAEFKPYKAKPFIDIIQAKCLDNFEAYFATKGELSIDEAMIKYKGRLSFVQYMPMKPTKRGIKVFCLCDASSGYMITSSIYTGKNPNQRDGGSVNKIVTELVSPIKNCGYFVFMDNYFSSGGLFREHQIYACGTLRKNRSDFPPCLKNVKLANQGDSAFAHKGNTVVVLWRNKAANKPVTVLSTVCEAGGDDTVTRRRKINGQFTQVEINRPPSVSLYCKHMGGVDLSDQHRSYYTVSSRRHVKWWKYLFYFYMDISIINAWQLHGQSAEAKLTNFEFRLALAKSLIGTYEGR